MPPRPKSQKRSVPGGPNQRAPISSSVNKRLRGAMSVSSAASSFNSINSIVSGSIIEADTDFVEEYSSGRWVGLENHPEEDDAALEIYEDDYGYVDDYDEDEPGHENLPPPPPILALPRPTPRPLSEYRPSPPPPPPNRLLQRRLPG
ncbi:uncharacterized protein H6S33_001897 [Morchella sextelata]|uniref:uncharacterized protein n=1 Tax=Morchella sextelata TaxID=1174677 RepID=UPI001D04A18F|nr:uncharacterized protein H6S33_001897 [Morchella sextelata]KAH0608763.1 hypothetical protein H6S33_001897 [Morchella sextelata]